MFEDLLKCLKTSFAKMFEDVIKNCSGIKKFYARVENKFFYT